MGTYPIDLCDSRMKMSLIKAEVPKLKVSRADRIFLHSKTVCKHIFVYNQWTDC